MVIVGKGPIQQSSVESNPAPTQLLVPQTPERQCPSWSQSPSPSPHMLSELQQESPPLHPVCLSVSQNGRAREYPQRESERRSRRAFILLPGK